MTLPRNYDAWRLSGPDDTAGGVGEEEGQPCNRFPEPHEDAPRGHKPVRCVGDMVEDDDGVLACDVCGEVAE
jgi:hypothetical protein